MEDKDLQNTPANTEETGGRDNTGRFKKGVSGNPNGRPKAAVAVREMAKKQTKTAFEVIKELLSHPDDRIRLAAAKEMLKLSGSYVTTADVTVTPAQPEADPFQGMSPEELVKAFLADE